MVCCVLVLVVVCPCCGCLLLVERESRLSMRGEYIVVVCYLVAGVVLINC